jgi:hypothetical protein
MINFNQLEKLNATFCHLFGRGARHFVPTQIFGGGGPFLPVPPHFMHMSANIQMAHQTMLQCMNLTSDLVYKVSNLAIAHSSPKSNCRPIQRYD